MSEVTCKAVQFFIDVSVERGVDPARLIEGMPYSIDFLRDKNNRISWADFVEIGRRTRALGRLTDRDLEQVGRSAFTRAPLRIVMSIARLFGDPARFYKWMQRGNTMLFSNMQSFVDVKSPHELTIRIRVRDQDELSSEYLMISKGAIASMPSLLGYPEATVRLQLEGSTADFHVSMMPRRRSFLRRAFQAVTGLQETAEEILATNAALTRRLEELDSAHVQITKQAVELEKYQRNLERLVEERTAELRDARDQLAGTVEQLREAQGARERFFANISHEIRTPLSLILLAAGDVEAKAGHLLDERGRSNLSTVADSARKLVRLVDELLLLAAADETKLALEPRATDVSRLITTLGATWLPAAEAAGLTLVVRTQPSLVGLVDPVALERIATNLVSNAVKYTPSGGTVELEAALEPLGIRISVLDTGPGIAPELRSRLFGRFERGASGRSGSGIGLSLVKQLVVAHGGTVDAIDRPGGGTEMRVSLPDHRLAAAAASTPIHPRMRPADYGLARAPAIVSGTVVQARRTARGTILVAEDDAQLADLLARLLSDEYKVVVALDGRAAIDMVRKHQPQLLVTDVEMPEMDGIELARQFRELTGDRLSPIIILSAITDVGTRLSGLEAGAVDYVLKPFDPRELIARVRSQFAMRDLAMRLRRAEQLSAMGTLAAGLAHELRNPANGLVNAIAPLRSRLPAGLVDTNSPTGQLLEVIAECSSQVAFLSSQLLGFQAGGTLEMRTVGLTEVIERAIVLSGPQLDGIVLKQDLDGVGAIRCAPQLLSHVVANLIQNAAQAAGRGGWVEVTSRAVKNTITVEIADSGPGVPPELRERVFEPFFTTKPGVGTGIGLPMAREIVQRHGGVLEIRERAGRVIFAVDIPAPQSV